MGKEKSNKEMEAKKISNLGEHKLFSDDMRERQKKQRRVAAVWPVLSFILHVLVFGILVFCTPLREIIIPERKEEQPSALSQLNEYELQEIDQNIEEARENEIAKYLEELQTILHNMEYMKNELLKDYDDYAEEYAEDVKPEMEEIFELLIEKQEQSLEIQQETEEFVEELVDDQEAIVDEATLEETIQSVNENEQDFKDIEAAQADAQNLLDILTAKAEISGMDNTAKAAELAYEAQQDVNELQAEMKQLVWELRAEDSKAKEEAEKKKEEEEKLASELTPKRQAAEKTLEQERQEREQATQELATAEKEKQEAEKERNEARQEMDQARRERDNARNQMNQAKNQLNNQNNNVNNKQRELTAAEQRTERAEQQLASAQSAEAEKQEKLDQANQELAAAEQARQEAEQNKDQNPNAVHDANNRVNAAKRNADAARNEQKRAADLVAQREHELARAQEDESKRAEALAQAQASQEEAQQKFDEKSAELAAAEQRAKDAEARHKEGESQLRQANDRLNASRNQDRNAQRELSNAERDLDRKKADEANAQRRIQEYQAKAEAHMAAADEKAKRLDAMDTQASEAQAEALEMVRQVATIAANEVPSPEQMADESMTSPELANVTLTHLPLAEAYEKAKELEHQIAEHSRDIKAIELAISQEMALSQAIEITDVATTIRPDFDTALLESQPTTEEEFLAKREEMTSVVRETQNISAVAMSKMTEAEAMVFPERYGQGYSTSSASSEDRLSRMYEISEMSNEIKEAGSEDTSQRAKDLSGLMAAGDSMLESKSGTGTSSSSSSPSSMSPTQGQQGAKGRPSRKPSGGRASSANTAQYIPHKNATPDLSGVRGPSPDPVRGGDAAGMGVPPLSREMGGKESGSFIGKNGVPAVWMRVENWYTIGPFPNQNRVNLTRKFAPESVIDLDATYVGKNGQIIKWEYCGHERAGEEIRPYTQRELQILRTRELERADRDDHTYEIWYAYTEIFAEEEGDYWVALGSDDRMDVWINDYKIWSSSNELKYWKIDEGFRKVHLRRGRNTVLARIENGQYVISWSIFISKGNLE